MFIIHLIHVFGLITLLFTQWRSITSFSWNIWVNFVIFLRLKCCATFFCANATVCVCVWYVAQFDIKVSAMKVHSNKRLHFLSARYSVGKFDKKKVAGFFFLHAFENKLLWQAIGKHTPQNEPYVEWHSIFI